MKDNSLLQEVEDDLQRQKLEALWKRYGIYVVGAALVIVMATAAITIWRSHQADLRHEATREILLAINSKTQGSKNRTEKLEQFAASRPSSPQGDLARINAAGMAARAGDKTKAAEIYLAVADDKTADADMRQLAGVLYVEAMLDKGDPADLRARLEPLMKEDGIWRHSAQELSAHLALKSGDKAEAKRLLTPLSQPGNEDIPPAMTRRAADMLRWLNGG